MTGDDISQRTADAIISELMFRVASSPDHPDAYEAVMRDAGDMRPEIEAAMERHGDRMRAAGHPGW